MATPAATSTCARHPKRDRVASCGQCGDALCRDCVVHTPVGIKCAKCTGEQAARPAPRERRRDERAPKERPRWLVPAVIGAAAVLLAALIVGRSGGGGRPEVAEDLRPGDPSESDTPVERRIEIAGGGGVRIGASFTFLPRGQRPVAGVLIVPGFGAVDRDAVMAIANTPDGSADRLSQDQNYSRPGSPDNLLRDLNDNLLAAGMATLRYDKRGSGESPLRADQPLSYDDLIADAKAGLDFIGQHRETAGVPMAVVGVDQGGLIALRLAATDARVKSLILVSTFGRPLADVIAEDFLAARGEGGTAPAEQIRQIAAQLAAGQPLPKPEEINGHLRPVLVPAQERYLRAIFSLDPVAEARAVRVPVLLVRGGRDTSVTATDSERLKGALAGGAEELVVVDGDHNLGANTRRDPTILTQIASWIPAHLG